MNPFPHTAEDILEQTFLDVRAKILEIAAAFDRIERADVQQSATVQPKWKQLQQAVRIVSEAAGNRAEQIQLHFSDSYDPHWERPTPARAD